MEIWETVVIFGVAPLAIAVFFMIAFLEKHPRTPRYKLGEQWTGEPVFWGAIDEQQWDSHVGSASVESVGNGGAASGKW